MQNEIGEFRAWYDTEAKENYIGIVRKISYDKEGIWYYVQFDRDGPYRKIQSTEIIKCSVVIEYIVLGKDKVL